MLKSSDKCVAIFSNTFWSIYNFRSSLIHGLQAEGYQVVALSADDNYRSYVENLGCETIIIKNLDAKSTSLVKELRLLLEIRSALKNRSCNYIYTFTIKPNLYTSLASMFCAKRLIIITVNGLGNAFSGSKTVYSISLKLFKLAFKRAYKIVFQNKDDYNFFQDKFNLDSSKVHFVRGSGVDIHEFNFHPKTPKPGENLIFLLACRLLREKGVYEYIETAQRIKARFSNAKFLLIGMSANNQSAIDINDIIPFKEKGYIELMPATDNVSSMLEQVDVLVLPSYYNEGVPRILLEGLSKGLPIITTDSVGCRETVIDELNGFLIQPKSVDSLEYAVSRMIKLPPDKRMNMCSESRKLAVAEFNDKDVVNTYLNIIEENKLQIAFTGA